MSQLPLYQCHKVVRAAEIITIVSGTDGRATLIFIGPIEPTVVGQDYLDKHKPEVGGYFVQYQDGYQSYSPKKAFETGYSPRFGGGFPLALTKMMDGKKMRRACWPNQHIQAKLAHQESDMSMPYLYVGQDDVALVPWVPSNDDLMANDWLEVAEKCGGGDETAGP